MCFWHKLYRRQNNENADQYLSLYHCLRLFSATRSRYLEQNIFSREIGHSGSQVVRSMKREEKMAALCGDVFISKETFFCCIPVFQSFLSLTLHIPLLVKGSPLTYTLDKFRARKCIFWTVFLCQICMGLHEIYSYALLTKREVKMAGYWPGSFVAFLWSETNKPGEERRCIPRSISGFYFMFCLYLFSPPWGEKMNG